MANILLYDLETSYIITEEHKWGLYDENPIERKIVQDWQILCVAWKWLDEKKIHVVGQDDFKGYKPGKLNDRGVVEELHKLFTQADVVIAHNGNSFDQKKSQARMMFHKLPPPSPYQQIDTKLAIKRVAAHTSNKLSDLANSLELTHKLDAGGTKTWDGCMAGEKKAWKHMKEYNKGDIETLEELYLTIRPWIKNHPALNTIDNRPTSCKYCGSTNIQSRGTYPTKTQRYRRFQCQDCAAWLNSRTADYMQSEERMQYV